MFQKFQDQLVAIPAWLCPNFLEICAGAMHVQQFGNLMGCQLKSAALAGVSSENVIDVLFACSVLKMRIVFWTV